GRRDRGTIGHPTNCPRASPPLRVSTNHRGAPPPGNAGEPQTRGADHAERQPAGPTTERLQGHHELEPQVRDLSELSGSDETDPDQSALGSGYHLHSAEGGICLLGGDPRCVLSQSGGLGAGSYPGDAAHRRSAGTSHRAPTTEIRPRASLGSRAAIRSRGIYRPPREVPHDSEHEPTGEPLRQGQLRKLHQDTEARRNLREQVHRSGRSESEHRRLHRAVLQSAAFAFGAWLSIAGRIRAQGRKSGRKWRRNDRGFCEQSEEWKYFERAAGDGDSNAVPFPRSLLLLGDAKTLLRKRKLCPKKLCHL